MKFETKQLDKATYQITATIPFSRLEEEKRHVLRHFQESVEIKGFRKGKAPLDKVEQAVNKGDLYGEIVNHLLPGVYAQALKEAHLKPIISPRVKIKQFDLENKGDLVVDFITCVRPEVKLPDYKNLKVPPKIVKPGDEKETEKTTEERQAEALEELLANSEVVVPQLLIDEEADRSMAKLVDRTEQLGLTPEQYLKATGKTADQMRQSYAKQAEQALKQEFVMAEIAQREGITATDEEVEEMIKVAGDEKVQTELRKQEHQPYIQNVIVRRKVLDLISK